MDREQLVEAMAIASCDRMDSPGDSTWAELTELGREEWRLDMRAALGVAESVVREDERLACLNPAEVAALRAERDAAWNEVEREREKYKDEMHAALVEVGRWWWRSGLQDAELTNLRGEVENMRAALKPRCAGRAWARLASCSALKRARTREPG